MSGHSKWHNIQAHKGKQDAVRANTFTKCAKAITLAAQKGGADPNTNFSLRLAIDKAKAVSMPKDNIERAIKRGAGQGDDAVRMEEIVYEGFGPGKVALLIKTVTDNRNRTLPEIKHILTGHEGAIAGEGSVKWMFEHKGIINLPTSVKLTEEQELALIDAGALDISVSLDEGTAIMTGMEHFQAVLTAIRAHNLETTRAELTWLAKDPIAVTPENEPKLQALLEALEENDDVDDIYTNAA